MCRFRHRRAVKQWGVKDVREFKTGRCFLDRLAKGDDLTRAIEGLCVEEKIETAAFSLIGSVTSATLGAYDQTQQVYITFKKDEPLEIISCTGNISTRDGKPFVHAHALLANMDGATVGGHVFPETSVYAAEIYLRELLGPPLERRHDTQTGLHLWP